MNAGAAITSAPYRFTFDSTTVANGTYNLTAVATEAIDKATALPEVTTDIDRKPRGAAPDVGAHEFPGP